MRMTEGQRKAERYKEEAESYKPQDLRGLAKGVDNPTQYLHKNIKKDTQNTHSLYYGKLIYFHIDIIQMKPK